MTRLRLGVPSFVLCAVGAGLLLATAGVSQVTSTARTASTGWSAMATAGVPAALAPDLALPVLPITTLSAQGSAVCTPAGLGPQTARSSAELEFGGRTLRFSGSARASQPLTRGVPFSCVGGLPIGEFSGGVVWSLSSPTPVSGVIRGTIQNPFVEAPGIRTSVEVELIDLATGLEFAPDRVGPVTAFAQTFGAFDTWRVEWPVTLGAQPIEFEVRLTVRAEAFSPFGNVSALGEGEVQLEFDATQTGGLSEFGTSCGPEFSGFRYERRPFSGQATEQVFVLSASGARQASSGAFLFGVTQIALPLPGAQCLLLTDPVVALPALGRTPGEYRLEVSLPVGPIGLSALGQFVGAAVSGRSVQFTTSEGFVIQL